MPDLLVKFFANFQAHRCWGIIDRMEGEIFCLEGVIFVSSGAVAGAQRLIIMLWSFFFFIVQKEG